MREMDQKESILVALQQIHNVSKLFKDNDYHNYICGKLIMVETELERQLAILMNHERSRIQGSNQQYTDASEQQRSQFSDFAGTD